MPRRVQGGRDRADQSRPEAPIRQVAAYTYGVPRITAELCEAGERVNHKRVARVIRGAGQAGLRLRRRHRTTVADLAAAKTPDLVGRDSTASGPNMQYVGDITCLQRGVQTRDIPGPQDLARRTRGPFQLR
ncbi:IS3 family transposase [Streptomyces tauricus]|uniref:IS3 family transposase n=1 Tax=Streptomyces tauricus TaxID=68274 RepID=UPI003F4DF788